ncbi:MAG: hypothetical protein LBK66_13680, partial [Spirochaetaceae bacterium]|nr:hypothetical protein [Spirochaetaceae bacterium]
MKRLLFVGFILIGLGGPLAAQTNGGVEITDLVWKMNDAVISEACVKDNVRITFNTVHIPRNSNL